MKKILTIGTGGTIASELASDGLTPELDAEQLLRFVPQVRQLCSVDCVQPFCIDSTNMSAVHWLQIAACIRAHYDEYDGFVITHGTDTMAYTAAALSYLIQNADKPIILTGAQKPIVSDNTDSKINLSDSFQCACSDLTGVMIVFNGKVICGTRARKTRSKSFQAFSSINYPELAYVQDGILVPFLRLPSQGKPTFYDRLDDKVSLLKLIPCTDSSLVSYLLGRSNALIIESYGVGGLPSYRASGFYEVLNAGIAAGKTVVLTTQVENEGSNLSVYRVGNRLKSDLGILEAYDMTTEAVVAKLMWILAQTHDPQEVRTLFYRPVANDLLYPLVV